jgi:hypothetical protein
MIFIFPLSLTGKTISLQLKSQRSYGTILYSIHSHNQALLYISFICIKVCDCIFSVATDEYMSRRPFLVLIIFLFCCV